MFTKVKLKIVQNGRKIPVGGIVALNFGPILNRRVGVGAAAGVVFTGIFITEAETDCQVLITRTIFDFYRRKKKKKRFFNH